MKLELMIFNKIKKVKIILILLAYREYFNFDNIALLWCLFQKLDIDKEQVEERKVYLSFRSQSVTKGSLGRNSRQVPVQERR